MHFEENRLSIVFFTRSKYLELCDEYRARLEEAGFPSPDHEWKAQSLVSLSVATSIKIQEQKQKEDDHHAATFHKKIHQKRIAPKGVHRERWVPDGDCEGVREAVLGFQVEEINDPDQAVDVTDKQSKEIPQFSRQGDEFPIAKTQRRNYVWVAQALPEESDGDKVLYTWDVDNMFQMLSPTFGKLIFPFARRFLRLKIAGPRGWRSTLTGANL